jgi:hypothetical protein
MRQRFGKMRAQGTMVVPGVWMLLQVLGRMVDHPEEGSAEQYQRVTHS